MVEIQLIFALLAPASKIRVDFQSCHIWAWNLPIGQSCTYTLFLPQGVKIQLIFPLRAAVCDIQANFQNCHIWALKLGHGLSAKRCTYTLSTPGDQNLAYFHSRGSSFRDKGWFSKLPYLGMKLGNWAKFQKLHVYSLSTPCGRNWAYVCSTGSGIRDTGQFPKLPYLGM